MRTTISATMVADGSTPGRRRHGRHRRRHGHQAELAKRVGDQAYLFALQMTGDRELAADVAQDGALRFFQNIDRYDADRPVEPWLYQIVRNRIRDLHRRRSARPQETLDSFLEPDRPEPVDPTADPTTEVERRELRREVWRALDQLSAEHREILVLRDYQDLPYADIAEILDIPKGTVMSRLHAARNRLRTAIEAGRADDRPPSTPRPRDRGTP